MFSLRMPLLARLTMVVAGALFLGQTSPLFAQRSAPIRNSPAVTAAFKNVVAKPSESTVRIFSDEAEAALGTIVTADGWIISKASELRGNLVCKLKDGRSFKARLVGIEDNYDLAMLKIEARGLRPIEWRSSKTAEVGSWVAAPSPGAEPAAFGVVSVGTRKPSRGEMPRTAPKENSGYLGVLLEESDDGPTIGRVTPGSPAEKAELKEGDIVLAVSGRLMRTRERLIATIQTLRPGQVVSVKIKRGEDEKELKVKLERFPLNMLSRGERMNMMGSELSHRLGGFPLILQHDLLIKPSDCGGPLVDLDGKTVGINIARAGRTESYAVPAEAVQGLLADLQSGKLAPK
jgi:serine protease Do